MVYPVKPLIIGAKGFIGKHLYQHFRSQFPDLMGTHHTSVEGLQCLDLEAPLLDFSVSGYQYAIIAGGINNPRVCEENPQKSYRCNVEGPLKLGSCLAQKGVTPIFFSTEYVFDGSKALYTSDATPTPLNVYGQQKAELEQRANTLDGLVIRLSKVYGLDKGDGTLFDEMAVKLIQKQPILAARDQIFAPISINDVIRSIEFYMHTNQRGIVNLSGLNYVSRLEMAKKVARMLDVEEHLVKEIDLKELNDSVTRPQAVRLQSTFPTNSWENDLEKIVRHYAK